MRVRTGFGVALAMVTAVVVAGIAVVGGEGDPQPTGEEEQTPAYGLECFWVNANGDRQRQTCPEALRLELEQAMNGIRVTPGRGDTCCHPNWQPTLPAQTTRSDRFKACPWRAYQVCWRSSKERD